MEIKVKNIILIGFMGTGKTSVGKLLAKELGIGFIDTDEEIEKENHQTISNIFQEYGEEYFRKLETDYIKKLYSLKKPMVISTGGGLPLRECNAAVLRELGIVVYLQAKKDTIINRVKENKNRPLLNGEHLSKQIDNLLSLREPTYKKCAHIKINTDSSLSEIVSAIKKQYNEWDGGKINEPS